MVCVCKQETCIDDIVKKINLIKICNKMYVTFVVLLMFFIIMTSFIKINIGESVRGNIKYEDGKKIVTICILNENNNEIDKGDSIVLVSKNRKLIGMVKAIEKIDMGLMDGEIIKYSIEITSDDNSFDENVYYDFQLYSTKKRPIIYYLYQNS